MWCGYIAGTKSIHRWSVNNIRGWSMMLSNRSRSFQNARNGATCGRSPSPKNPQLYTPQPRMLASSGSLPSRGIGDSTWGTSTMPLVAASSARNCSESKTMQSGSRYSTGPPVVASRCSITHGLSAVESSVTS